MSSVKRGDVLFTADSFGSLMHGVISTAQRIGSPFKRGHASSVHAAIVVSVIGQRLRVAEAVGSGLRIQNIPAGNYRAFTYRGPRRTDLRELVALMAESFVGMRNNREDLEGFGVGRDFGSYAKGSATLSVVRRRGGQTHNSQFGPNVRQDVYCSNLVWRCVHAAWETLGDDSIPHPLDLGGRSQISPRDLEAVMSRSLSWHQRKGGHKFAYNG